MKSEWDGYAVWVQCGNLSEKRAHTQFVRERSSTLVSTQWASVDWSLPKMWNWCVRADLHLKKKMKHRVGQICRTFPHYLACEDEATTPGRLDLLAVESLLETNIRTVFGSLSETLWFYLDYYQRPTIELYCNHCHIPTFCCAVINARDDMSGVLESLSRPTLGLCWNHCHRPMLRLCYTGTDPHSDCVVLTHALDRTALGELPKSYIRYLPQTHVH